MGLVDPTRYRARLVLMASLSDDGLEDLIHRLVRREYPDAHRTRRGRDGGIDVLSDYEKPPARGWQAKNYTDNNVDWGKCRKSLKAAMNGTAPPNHYTFVFPRGLKASERDYWRDHFLPEHRKIYSQLDRLDYWDDLAGRLEDRPDLVNLLNDGALAGYARDVAAASGRTGVNPLASASDLASDAAGMATHSIQVGQDDPRFAYGESGREVGRADQDLPDRRLVFTLTRDAVDQLPRYALTLREGNRVTELTAQPRPGVDIEGPEPWFAPDAAGGAMRDRVRASLAKGQPITVEVGEVGLDPGELPDRFRELADADGMLRNGRLRIGLSEPLALTVTLRLSTTDGVVDLAQTLPIYRVPALPGDWVSYAGAFGGALVTLDIHPPREQSETNEMVEMTAVIALALQGERPQSALRGLGFARAFGEAEQVRFDCPRLLPDDGVNSQGCFPASDESKETWERAVHLTEALRLLEDRDGKSRILPDAMTAQDGVIAELVLNLLTLGEVRVPAAGEFEAPLPPGTNPHSDPEALTQVEAPLPALCGRTTGLIVEQSIEDALPLELVEARPGVFRLRCRARGDRAAIVMRLVGEAGEAPDR